MSDTSLPAERKKELPESVMIFGCGYVGAALAEELLAAGVRVGALTRNTKKAAHLRSLGLSEVIIADLQDTAWHSQLKDSYVSVVNCVSSAGGGLEGYRKSYVEGQEAILKWTSGQPIRTYLYTSSTSVYPQDGGTEVDETADTSAASATGRLLRESEQLLVDIAHQFEAWYVLRLAGIYGPARHYLLDLVRSGEAVIPGSGDYFLNLIHRDDIVSAIFMLLASTKQACSGFYNLADNQPTKKVEVVEWLAKQLGKPAPHFDSKLVSPRLERRGGRMPSRKILNRKIQQTLNWSPKHSDFRSGYDVLLNANFDQCD